MNIRDEELLNRYFERQMSSGEEQNFLIDVAARDDMRVAFRSQLELLKAVRRDKDVMRGATFVRERTLSALGLSGAMLPTLLAEDEAEAAPVIASATSSGWRVLLQKPIVMLTGGLLVGSIATFSVVNMDREEVRPASSVITTIPAPQTEIFITEPAPVQNISEQPEVVASKTKPAAPKAATNLENTTSASSTSLQTNPDLPLINKSEPASITVKRPQIKKPSDVAK